MDGVLGGRQVEEEATGGFGRTRRGGRRKVDVLSVWKDRLLSHGWMGERLLFTSLVRPFLSSRLEGADFSIFYVVAKKGYCSTRASRGTRQAWLPRKGGRESMAEHRGLRHEDFSSALAQPKCWLAGNRAPMKLFPASSFLPCEPWNRETRRDPWWEGRERKNE